MDKDKSEEITKALASWIARNGRPINIISDDNSYVLPTHRTINSRIDELFQQEKNKILVLLESMERSTKTSCTCE